MGVPGFIFGVVLFILIQLSAGQLSLKEDLKTLKECDINNINFNCSNNDEIIAVQSLEFWYTPECETVCCEYNSSHTKQDPSSDDIQNVHRMCSGKQSCSLNLDGEREFGSFGGQIPVYVLIQFHCIPRARRTSVCSSDVELMSNGLPLYLTSENFPEVATGDGTCSCLFSSCWSNIILYVIDVDLNLDPGNCEQSIQVMNGTNAALHEMNCESYYDRNDITVTNLNSRYFKTNSIDNSTQIQEGYFFLGFAASDQNASFITLTCQDESASSMCIDCGNVPRIANGMVTLVDNQNTKYGALANVTCSEGFESDSNNITCLVSGQWSQILCTSKGEILI
ncbi:uncharacterized protein LOC123551036 [Mercenaria mercenaria]|uniref:uncharacterized protein LOC123551036 n=1 Tax=Mercenaria mercenaria TaxID=6596 RepID=UPI00234F6311|nr:uncharacterized protein LOC123551036 [Mercenaria mercenaria]